LPLNRREGDLKMNDLTQQMPQTTSPGTEDSSALEQVENKTTINKEPESVYAFEVRARIAAGQQEYIEADDYIIRYFQPKGLGPSGFFTYAGLKVCPIGKSEEIARKEQVSMHELLQPDDGKVLNK